MESFTAIYNIVTASFSVVLQIVLVAIISTFFLSKNKLQNPYLQFLSRNSYLISFLIAMGGMIGSLIYSDIIGYQPCTLCWYARILLYPEALLLGLELWKGNRVITDYIIALSGLGVLLSLYQKYIELGGNSLIPCSATAVSCSKVYVNEFGYLTIPVMALTSFAMILVLMLLHNYFTKRETKNN